MSVVILLLNVFKCRVLVDDVGLKIMGVFIVCDNVLMMLWIFGFSLSVIVVGFIFLGVCRKSGLLKVLCKCLIEWLIEDCVSFMCLVILEVFCNCIRLVKINRIVRFNLCNLILLIFIINLICFYLSFDFFIFWLMLR